MARIGVISAYPDEDWHAARMVAAASARVPTEVLSPLDFSAEVCSSGTRLLVSGRPHRAFDAFLTPRAIGDDGDPELQIALYRTLSEDGALVVNDVRALTVAIDKFKTSWLLARGGVATPRATVVQRERDVASALASLGGRAVAKPLYGSLGIGVELVEDAARAAECLKEWRALYLQEFVVASGWTGGDIRAFVVGKAVEAAIARRAPPGEFRANIHLGGQASEVLLDDRTARLAVRAARLLGLDYAGVDLMVSRRGPVVLEVNGTPLFRGIFDATGRDMAEAIVEHVLARVAAGAERQPARPERAEGREAARRAAGRRTDGAAGAKERATWPRR